MNLRTERSNQVVQAPVNQLQSKQKQVKNPNLVILILIHVRKNLDLKNQWLHLVIVQKNLGQKDLDLSLGILTHMRKELDLKNQWL